MNRRKEGYSTILFLLIVSVALPLGLFFFVELKQGYLAKDQMLHLNENAVDAALWQVDHLALARGEIQLDEGNARLAAENVLDNGWNEELSTDLPEYEVQVQPTGTTMTSERSGIDYPIEGPAVLTYSNFRAKGIFFSRFHDVKNETASYIRFGGKASDVEVPESQEPTGDVSIRTLSVVNPKNYPAQEGFPVQEATGLQLLGHSEVSIAVDSARPIANGTVRLLTTDEKHPVIEQVLQNGTATFYLPEGIEKDSEVSLEVELTLRTAEGMETYRSVTDAYGTIVGQTPELLELYKAK